MTFWIITGALALAVTAVLALSLRARAAQDALAPAEFDLRVYRDQLRDVDQDLARGVLNEADAERVRAEVSRRILAADTARTAETAGAHGGTGAPVVLATLLGAGLIGGSFALYLNLGAPGYGDLSLNDRIAGAEQLRIDRPGQKDAEASLPVHVMPPDASPDYVALIEQLRATVAQRPDDLQGLVLLAQNEANVGNFTAAADALESIVKVKGDGASAKDLTDYADMLVIAAGGYVSPEAEAVLGQVLARDKSNGIARYYLGLMMAQTGRPDTAFRIWDQLLREGPPDAPWIEPVLTQIPDLARRAGVRYQVPEIGGSTRGPDDADIAAAGQMSPEDRMQMIEGMVSGLSERLASQGGPVQDWAQLITALGVLGRIDQAAAIYANAIDVFAEDPSALDTLLRAGQKAGVAE